MQYLLLLYMPVDFQPDPEARGAWMQYTSDLQASGAMVSGAPLEPVTAATSVRIRDGADVVTDGPFAETKEILGGYYLIDVPDLDAALKWARQMPNIRYGTVEVRPVMEIPSEVPTA